MKNKSKVFTASHHLCVKPDYISTFAVEKNHSMKRTGNLILTAFVLTISVLLSSCNDMKRKADLIVYNARIYTVDSSFSVVSAIAVRDGKILDLGTTDHILSRYGATVQINAKQQFVYPGFIDAHSHFYGLAYEQQYADLTSAKSFDEVIDILKAWRKNHPSDWLLGRGWDQNKWSGQKFPDNTLLDKTFPGVPVVLTRIDGHAVLASSEAIEKATLKNIPAGEALFNGERFTGIFLEGTADKIKNSVPPLAETETEKLLIEASQKCFEAGLTSVTDAGLDLKDIIRLEKLQQQQKLNLRLNVMLNPTEENFKAFVEKGIHKTSWITVRSVKLYADGALGSRGACLKQPYSDDPSNKGLLVITPEFMQKVCEIAYKSGYQVSTHAIGDSAVGFVLRSYARVLQGINDRRWRIEHSQVVDPDDIELFGKYNIIPSVQGTHATSDMAWAKLRLGKRVANAYAYKRLLQQNGWLPNGTDFPIESIEPLKTFYASVVRKDAEGNPAEGFQLIDALTREEALKSVTIWAAKAAFEENEKGSLEKGKFGDLVILDKDIMHVPEKELLKTRVLYTILDGKVVYDASKHKE